MHLKILLVPNITQMSARGLVAINSKNTPARIKVTSVSTACTLFYCSSACMWITTLITLFVAAVKYHRN